MFINLFYPFILLAFQLIKLILTRLFVQFNSFLYLFDVLFECTLDYSLVADLHSVAVTFYNLELISSVGNQGFRRCYLFVDVSYDWGDWFVFVEAHVVIGDALGAEKSMFKRVQLTWKNALELITMYYLVLVLMARLLRCNNGWTNLFHQVCVFSEWVIRLELIS